MKIKILTFLLFFACLSKAEEHSLSLHNGNMEMNVINYGARIQTLKFAGQDMVLGFDTLDHYTKKKQNFGATVGRYIGRIIGGKLPYCYLDETPTATKLRNGAKAPTKKTSPCRGDKRVALQLQVGSNGDCSHGGTPGFSQQYWTITSHNDSTCTLRYVSPDGENGFPGELTLDVTYTLQHDALRIDYSATTTKPTVLNPSNHSFFNLSANLGEAIHNELLWINSDSTALYNSKKQVTGQLASVTGTPFDFRTPKPLGQDIDADNEQIKFGHGYDHNYVLNKREEGELSFAARITDPNSGRTLECFTTEPGMQLYTANYANGYKGVNGCTFPRRSAVCLEAQHFPDTPNRPYFPSVVLNPGQQYKQKTIYRFGVL
jgi:aldose 1-epimerase